MLNDENVKRSSESFLSFEPWIEQQSFNNLYISKEDAAHTCYREKTNQTTI